MPNTSLQTAPDVLGALASSCATESFEGALERAVELLTAAGTPVVGWCPAADGWERVVGADSAPRPDESHDAWVAAKVVVGDRTAAVLMLGAGDVGAQALADAIAGMLACTAQRDEAQRQAEVISRRFADNQRISRVGSYDWHIATDTNIWTDTLFRIYGCEPGSFEPSYEEFLNRIHPDDREHIRTVHAKAYEEGGSYEMHERIVWPDGTIRTLWSMGEVICDAEGTPIRMVGVCEDVTEALIDQERTRRALASVTRSEVERSAALELNDNVVQGLTAVAWALDAGLVEPATAAARRTLHAAREMMDRLLNFSKEEAIVPGDLVRSTQPPSVLQELHSGHRSGPSS